LKTLRNGRCIPPVLVLAGVLAAGVLGGCRGQTRTPDLNLQPPQQRLAEAHRLALEGQRAHKAGDHERALQLYQESLQHSRELHAVWNNMGLLLIDQGHYMDAVEVFRAAADIALFDPQPYYNVGYVYDAAGHTEPALKAYERALERNPRYIPALRGYVRAAKLLDIADEATLKRVRTAIMVDHDPQWRRIHEMEQYRVESAIREERNSGRARGATGVSF
jgi:tetratricopeptide (TPR) repeat protein